MNHRYEVYVSNHYIEIIPAGGETTIDGPCVATVTTIEQARMAALEALSRSQLPEDAQALVAGAIRSIRAADVASQGGCTVPLVDCTLPGHGEVPRIGVSDFSAMAILATANHPIVSGLKNQVQQLLGMHMDIAKGIAMAVQQALPRREIGDRAFAQLVTADFLLRGAVSLLLNHEEVTPSLALAFIQRQCQSHIAEVHAMREETLRTPGDIDVPGDEIDTPSPDMQEWLARHVGIELER